jgi:hypothetical protein
MESVVYFLRPPLADLAALFVIFLVFAVATETLFLGNKENGEIGQRQTPDIITRASL